MIFDSYLTGASGNLEKNSFWFRMKQKFFTMVYKIRLLKQNRWIDLGKMILYTVLVVFITCHVLR